MPIKGVTPKCYILSLFVRDDGERFVLGSGYYEFKDKQMHFKANTVANDVIEVQGNDGYLLAGQVRRPGSQDFDGFVGDGTVDKAEVEQKRRDFLAFFRKNHFYKVVYVFSDGTAIQRKRGFLTDDPTVKELYQIYPEYHVALNFEDVNYYSYAEDEDGEEIYAKIAQIQLTQRKATGGLVWDSVGVVWEEQQWGGTPASAGGSTSFQVNNQTGKNAPLASVQLNGDAFQQTYSGKNLFNVFGDLTYSVGSVGGTTTANQDGTLTTTTNGGSVRGHGQLITGLTPGETYTLTVKVASTTSTRPTVGYISVLVGGTTTQLAGIGFALSSLEKTQTVTLPSDANSVWLSFMSNGIDASTTYSNVQFELGSATPFEPYVGGTASPNPDYPQDINVVTGEQTVKVMGKNLFDKTSYPGSMSANMTGEQLPTGIRVMNTASVSTTTTRVAYFKVCDLSDVVGKSISIRAYMTASSYNIPRLSYGYCNSSFGNRVEKGHLDSSGDITFTVNDIGDSTMLYIGLHAAYGATAEAPAGSYVDYKLLQVEIGSPTSYTKYVTPMVHTIDLGSTELCKIGTYQDYIYKSGDDWYVHKATGKYTLTGNEEWTQGATTATRTNFRAEIPNISPYTDNSKKPDVFVNRFTPVSYNANWFVGGVSSRNTTSQMLYFIVDQSFTLNSWKTWLTTNDVTVYYQLATPTDTKITDATLIGELEELKAMWLFVGINNFLVASTSPNLPAPLDITYYTQIVSLGGAEWSEGAPTGPTTVEVSSIDTVFPVWTVKGPAVNPQLSVLTTNTTFKYNGTVSASQELVVDMMNKTVLLNGVNMITNMEGDWASFNPGTNRVVYTTDNVDAEASTIEWQEIVG